MTGNEGRQAPPAGPPWSVDDLADLHAGVFDDAESARMWREVNADPEARAILEALEATSIDLSELPTLRMPDQVAVRMDSALAAESAARMGRHQQIAPVADLAAARKRRNRLLGWGTTVITTAAAVIAVGVISLPGNQQQSGANLAKPEQNAPPAANAEPPLALGGNDELNMAMLGKTLNVKDYGPLSDARKRAGCLAANDARPEQVQGTRQVRIDGTDGVLFVLTTGQKGQFRLLAVGIGCSAGTPAKLADKTVG
jgi:hypothetical protein